MSATPQPVVPANGVNFPHSPDEVTVDWLNGVLRDVGGFIDEPLGSFEAHPTTEGFGYQGSYARLHLRHRQPQPDAPQSLFVKFSTEKAMSKMFSKREVQFYRDVAPLVRLRIPRCYFAASDAESEHSLLILEDMTAGRGGDSLVGCSTQEAEILIRQVAAFHAHWWENSTLSQWDWLQRTADEEKITEIIRRAWRPFRQRYTDLLPTWAISTAERALRQLPDIFRLFREGPITLTHGDLQADNIRFDLPDAPLAIFDWQLAAPMQGAKDVSYFLARSLSVPLRRAKEDHLVEVYYAALVDAGVQGFSLETLRRQMKLYSLTFFLTLISSGVNLDFSNERGKQLFEAFLKRNIAVLEDHDVWEALS